MMNAMDIILDYCRDMNLKDGNLLMGQHLSSIKGQYSYRYDEEFDAAIRSLIQDGFFCAEGKHYRLTREGYDCLYPTPNMCELRTYIMKIFADYGFTRENNLLLYQHYRSYYSRLNPKEQDLWGSAVSSLVNEGYISIDGKNFRLTANGSALFE